MPEDNGHQMSESGADLLSIAVTMPGIADLMRIYDKHAEVAAVARIYADRTRSHVVVTAGASTA